MDNQVSQIQFALQGIKTEQFATFEEDFNPKKQIDIAVGLEFKLKHSSQLVGVFLSLHFEQSKKKILMLLVSCHFRIEDKSWENLIDKEKSIVVLPKDFVSHISMLTVGTARGLMFAKTEGTFCSQFIVPLINVSEMITKDATFEIKSE